MHIAAPARSEAPPHGICCHLHQMEITVLIRIKHLSRKRPFLVKVPFIRFPFTFSPNPGRWLLCVAEFSGIPSCYLYEIVKVQVRAFSFWRINPSPIKLGRGCLPTPFANFFIFFSVSFSHYSLRVLLNWLSAWQLPYFSCC